MTRRFFPNPAGRGRYTVLRHKAHDVFCVVDHERRELVRDDSGKIAIFLEAAQAFNRLVALERSEQNDD